MSAVETSPPPIWDRFAPSERLCITYTLHCNITCSHCNVEASPHRRDRLTREQVCESLQAGVAAGKRHVTFSGGEVFLYYDDLLHAVGEATRLGYEVDVETNAFWAQTEARALDRLRPVADAGLRGLCLSADAYHEEFYSTERTINAARAGRELGLLVEINFCPSPDPEADAAVLAALEESGLPFIRNPLLNRGRGRQLLQLTPFYDVADLKDCDSLTMTVHADGDVFTCCELEAQNHALKRTPVFLGRAGAGEGLAEAAGREHLVHEFYSPRSPAYFRRLVATDPRFAELANRRYRSICDFCVTALASPERVAAIAELVGREEQP